VDSVRLTPLKTIRLFALVVMSGVTSMAAAFAVGPGDSEGLLISLGFLLVTIPLAYLAVRWTKPGWVRWSFLTLIVALPIVVGIQVVASQVL